MCTAENLDEWGTLCAEGCTSPLCRTHAVIAVPLELEAFQRVRHSDWFRLPESQNNDQAYLATKINVQNQAWVDFGRISFT